MQQQCLFIYIPVSSFWQSVTFLHVVKVVKTYFDVKVAVTQLPELSECDNEQRDLNLSK